MLGLWAFLSKGLSKDRRVRLRASSNSSLLDKGGPCWFLSRIASLF